MAPPKGKGKAGRSAIADVVAREYTIHLHKRVRLTPQLKPSPIFGAAYCGSEHLVDRYAM